MKAKLNNLRMSPRKVRLVANAVKGKTVASARAALSFLPKAAAVPLKKLLNSAAKNAGAARAEEDAFTISDFRVDEGVTMKRHMPRARGSAFPIRKRTSKVTLVLGEVKSQNSNVKNEGKKLKVKSMKTF
jgi:large subunit ribosomal protein L22